VFQVSEFRQFLGDEPIIVPGADLILERFGQDEVNELCSLRISEPGSVCHGWRAAIAIGVLLQLKPGGTMPFKECFHLPDASINISSPNTVHLTTFS
jgi:hypothetical protein